MWVATMWFGRPGRASFGEDSCVSVAISALVEVYVVCIVLEAIVVSDGGWVLCGARGVVASDLPFSRTLRDPILQVGTKFAVLPTIVRV